MGQGWWYIVFFCLLSMFMRQVYPTTLLHKLLPLHLGGNHDHWVRGETNSAITVCMGRGITLCVGRRQSSHHLLFIMREP